MFFQLTLIGFSGFQRRHRGMRTRPPEYPYSGTESRKPDCGSLLVKMSRLCRIVRPNPDCRCTIFVFVEVNWQPSSTFFAMNRQYSCIGTINQRELLSPRIKNPWAKGNSDHSGNLVIEFRLDFSGEPQEPGWISPGLRPAGIMTPRLHLLPVRPPVWLRLPPTGLFICGGELDFGAGSLIMPVS